MQKASSNNLESNKEHIPEIMTSTPIRVGAQGILPIEIWERIVHFAGWEEVVKNLLGGKKSSR